LQEVREPNLQEGNYEINPVVSEFVGSSTDVCTRLHMIRAETCLVGEVGVQCHITPQIHHVDQKLLPRRLASNVPTINNDFKHRNSMYLKEIQNQNIEYQTQNCHNKRSLLSAILKRFKAVDFLLLKKTRSFIDCNVVYDSALFRLCFPDLKHSRFFVSQTAM